MAKTIRSRKAKGNRLVNKIIEMIRFRFNLSEHDVVRNPNSVVGKDVILSEKAKKIFPFAIEAKNAERLNIWKAVDQAESNKEDMSAMVVFSKNRSGIYVVIDFEFFLNLWGNHNFIPYLDLGKNSEIITDGTIKEFQDFKLYEGGTREENDDRS